MADQQSESSSLEIWRIFDNLLDAVFLVDRSKRLYHANESFRHLCDIPRRAISAHEDVSKFIDLPEECWAALKEPNFLESEYQRYREVDFRLKTGNEGRMQVAVDRVQDPALSNEELFLYILRDVTVEARLHAKYKAQITSNEHLIHELQRSLNETAFLRGLAMDLPIYADTAALLTAIAKRLKAELGFRDAQFFRLKDSAQSDNFVIDPISQDQRMGSRLREVVRSLEPMIKEMDGDNFITSTVVEPFGTFWISSMKPKMERPVLLVACVDQTRETSDYNALLEALSSQVVTLLDNRALYIASITDPLTALFNRRFFDSRLGAECLRSRDLKSPLSLVLLDVDFFKNVNDVYGHPAGDAVLSRLGQIIKKRIRNSDFAARVGGEEFALLLPETSPPDAWNLAEQLRKQISGTPIQIPGGSRELLVTVSCGIAGFPWPNEEPESLYQAADSALYRAKQLGRNRSHIDDGVTSSSEAVDGN